jgi:dienelactone hydrolase
MLAELRLPLHPGTMESSLPLYFKAGEHELFGWLHRRSNVAQKDVGVVLCQPFGYEAVCAHRGVRAFAEAIAAAGMPALRFDYLGCGDSPDIEPDADQIEVWSQDVLAAAEELKRQTGVSRICLLGFRLGALLAAMAASHGNVAHGLIGISPIPSGRRYLRDLRMTRLAAALGHDPEEAPGDNKQEALGIEVSGFALSAATLASLAKVDLAAIGSSLPAMLSIERALPAGGKVALPQSQSSHTRLALPGLVEMLMTPPQFAQVPNEAIAATLEWLSRHFGQSSVVPDHRAPTPGSGLLFLTGAAADDAPTERPVFFGADGSLFGILSRPRPSEPRRRAVILLNAGADHHICASRLYVSMARRWVQHGYTVLRMDFGGVGDSLTRPGRVDDEVFPQEAVNDIRDAIEFLRGGYGIRDVTLAGVCSGAYHALRGAVAGLPVNRILLVNPQNYFWKRGETLQGLQLAEVAHNPGLYRERMFSLAAWKRFFSGQVNIVRIANIYLQRPLLVSESRFRDIARRLRIRLRNDLGSELEDIVGRGVKVVFVFAPAEPGIELLKLQAGNSVARLAPRCQIHILDSGDHVFTRRGPRARMEEVVSNELFAALARVETSGSLASAVVA